MTGVATEAADAAVSPGRVRIAPCGPGAASALAGLYVEMTAAHGHAMTRAEAEAKLALMLAAPGARAYLFEADGAALGYALVVDLGDHVFLRNYCIAAPHRRRGLGAALFARLRAEVLGPRPLRLEVSAGHARAFWAAQGFAAWSTGMRTDAREESRC